MHKSRKNNKFINKTAGNDGQEHFTDQEPYELQLGNANYSMSIDANQDYGNPYFGTHKGSRDAPAISNMIQSANNQRTEVQNFAKGYPLLFSPEKQSKGKSTGSTGGIGI